MECAALYGFVPQPSGTIVPENSVMWQTLRCNGNSEAWFGIEHDDNKGRKVVAKRSFAKDVVLMEYFGQTVLDKHGYPAFGGKSRFRDREMEYCFVMGKGNETVAIQAWMEDGTFGRLVNHSSKADANCVPHRLPSRFPRLLLVSSRAIAPGDELVYSYGDEVADNLLEPTLPDQD